MHTNVEPVLKHPGTSIPQRKMACDPHQDLEERRGRQYTWQQSFAHLINPSIYKTVASRPGNQNCPYTVPLFMNIRIKFFASL